MIDRIELKEQAKSLIEGKTWEMFAPFLITILLESALIALTKYLYGLTDILIPLISFMYIGWRMNYIRKGEKSVDGYFNSIKSLDWDLKYLVTNWLSSLFISIGLVLFLVPGIIFALSFSMVPYIMVDSKKYKFMEAIRLSRDMMDGHKMEFLKLILSFIGWYILIVLTLGILSIWKGPYIYTTYSLYFEELKKEFEMKNPGTFDDLADCQDETGPIIEGDIIDEEIFDEDVF